MSEFITLIKYLPDVLALIKSIESVIDEAKTAATVADHLKIVKGAFDAKDASQLNTIFNQ